MSVTLRLMRSEVRIFWLSYVVSSLFFLLYSLFVMLVLDDALLGNQHAKYLLDFIMLMFGQVFGLGFSKYNLMNPFRHDPYTKKMRVLRRLPIPSSAIVHSRFVLLLFVAAINTCMLMLPAYLLSEEAKKVVAWPDYFAFTFLLYCFSVVMGSFYVLLETGYKGTRYWLIYSVMVGLTIVVQILLVASQRVLSIWLLTQPISEWPFWIYAVLTFITAGLVYLLSRWAIRRVMRRDYV